MAIYAQIQNMTREDAIARLLEYPNEVIIRKSSLTSINPNLAAVSFKIQNRVQHVLIEIDDDGKVYEMYVIGPYTFARSGVTYASLSVMRSNIYQAMRASQSISPHECVPPLSATVLMPDGGFDDDPRE